jgi:hypothetical protein
MKERPILFSGPMVKAILEGRKTQTRRVIKNLDGIWRLVETNYSRDEPNKALIQDEYGDYNDMPCPYGKVRDHLWVKETYGVAWNEGAFIDPSINYRATHERFPIVKDETMDLWKKFYLKPRKKVWKPEKWKSSRFMPRWASRINLEITGIRVERVQDISEEDALKDGGWNYNSCPVHKSPVAAFAMLWDSINWKKYPWASNPYVWCIEFKKI